LFDIGDRIVVKGVDQRRGGDDDADLLVTER